MRTQDGQDIDCEIDCADACMLHMGNKSQITKFDIVKLKTRRSKRESENVHQPNVYYLLR